MALFEAVDGDWGCRSSRPQQIVWEYRGHVLRARNRMKGI